MEEKIYTYPEDFEIVDREEYEEDIITYFPKMPLVANPLIQNAKTSLRKIERLLYSAPTFFDVIKKCVPEETFRVILTNEQKNKLAKGTLKLMSKKDGSLMANLVNPKTKKIISTVSLERVKLSSEITQAISNYSVQMQMAQIAEQIELVHMAIEEVRQGQENDRLALAYSCQQKFLQAISITNSKLKSMFLLQLVSDAEDSRNQLMQSQKSNLQFIKEQPESFWGKFVSGATPEKIASRMAEIRNNLCVLNMVSLIEAMAYQEMGEMQAAQISLNYYAEYIKDAYLKTKGFVKRLDLIDPSPHEYWSKNLPKIQKKIQALPCNSNISRLGENKDENE